MTATEYYIEGNAIEEKSQKWEMTFRRTEHSEITFMNHSTFLLKNILLSFFGCHDFSHSIFFLNFARKWLHIDINDW